MVKESNDEQKKAVPFIQLQQYTFKPKNTKHSTILFDFMTAPEFINASPLG